MRRFNKGFADGEAQRMAAQRYLRERKRHARIRARNFSLLSISMNCRLEENVAPQAIHGSGCLLLGANRTYALGQQCCQSRPGSWVKTSQAILRSAAAHFAFP